MLKYKKERKQGIMNPNQPWNQGDDIIKDMASLVAEGIDNDIEWLTAIKKQLPQLSKCRHPKKDHDITKDGQKYCMSCNTDLK